MTYGFEKKVFYTLYILVILYCMLHSYIFWIGWYIINININFKFKTKLCSWADCW